MCSPVQRGSHAVVQTVRELARQSGLADLRGDRIDVVPDPTHLERTLGEIEDAPRGARIPVPRLPHGTGIHEEPGPEPVHHREVRVAQNDVRSTGRADDRFVGGPAGTYSSSSRGLPWYMATRPSGIELRVRSSSSFR